MKWPLRMDSMPLPEAIQHVTIVVGSEHLALIEVVDRLSSGRLVASADVFVCYEWSDHDRESLRTSDIGLPAEFWLRAEFDSASAEVYCDAHPFRIGQRLYLRGPRRALGVSLPRSRVLAEWAGGQIPNAENRVQRGPQPKVRDRVTREMAAYNVDLLRMMTEEAMAATFAASRDTCRKARLEIVGRNSDKTPTIDN